MDRAIDITISTGPAAAEAEQDGDEDFRFDLFCNSRPPEWQMAGFDPNLLRHIMRHQFRRADRQAIVPSSRARGSKSSNSTASPIGRIVVDRPGAVHPPCRPGDRSGAARTRHRHQYHGEPDGRGGAGDIPSAPQGRLGQRSIDAALSPARLRGDRQRPRCIWRWNGAAKAPGRIDDAAMAKNESRKPNATLSKTTQAG